MSSFIPSQYQLLSISNNGDAFVFVRDDSSALKPKELIVARQKASFSNGSQRFSVPQLSANVSVGTVVGDPASPAPEKVSLKIVSRIPIGTPQGDLDTAIADLRAIINSDAFASAMVSLIIPMCCDEEEAVGG